MKNNTHSDKKLDKGASESVVTAKFDQTDKMSGTPNKPLSGSASTFQDDSSGSSIGEQKKRPHIY